jgi:hypothetical protein
MTLIITCSNRLLSSGGQAMAFETPEDALAYARSQVVDSGQVCFMEEPDN